ncbi:MAG TPA: aldo/keto reductase [Xanthobacteraceae bacterium]|jgi:aryl-alcohol dehydrogenase-like predicted oxidoreductase
MRTRPLGRNGPLFSELGLGCMGMSGGYGPADDKESIATIHAALDAGINYLDTADVYGMGQNEMLLREALKGGRRERVFIAVRFGALRGADGKWLGLNASPDAVKTFLAYSLRRLGTDYIDLYQPARVDPATPIEDTIGAIAEMVKAGYVRHVGITEASAATIRRAYATHPLASLQIEYSLFSRGIELEILPTLRELGMSLVAYGVLSRGLISDRPQGEAQPPGEIRGRMPRFAAENYAKNRALVESLRKIAKEKDCSVAQLAIAWVRSRGDDIVPLIGARRREQLQEALGALNVALSPQDLARIEQAVSSGSVAGERYAPQLMSHLDSEHGS